MVVLTAVVGQLPPSFALPEGRGIRLGDKSSLRLAVDIGTGYDSNPNQSSARIASDTGAGTSLLRPRLSLNIPNRRYDVDAKLNVSFRNQLRFADGPGDVNFISGDFAVSIVPTDFSRPLLFRIDHHLTRSVDPGFALPGTRVGATGDETRLTVTWNPPERRLGLQTVYKLKVQVFDRRVPADWMDSLGLRIADSGVPVPEFLDNMRHTLSATGDWRLPNQVRFYGNVVGDSMEYLNPDSPFPGDRRLGLDVGFDGPIPTWVNTGLRASVGTAFVSTDVRETDGTSAGSAFSSTGVYMRLDLMRTINARHRFTVSLERDASAVLVYKTHRTYRLKVRTHHRLLREIQLAAVLGYAHRSYEAARQLMAPNRRENFFEASLEGGMPLTPWLSVTLTTAYQNNRAVGAQALFDRAGVDTSFERFYWVMGLSATR